jgi:hypothetical protein
MVPLVVLSGHLLGVTFDNHNTIVKIAVLVGGTGLLLITVAQDFVIWLSIQLNMPEGKFALEHL